MGILNGRFITELIQPTTYGIQNHPVDALPLLSRADKMTSSNLKILPLPKVLKMNMQNSKNLYVLSQFRPFNR